MLFADLTLAEAEAYTVIIGAIFLGFAKIASMILDYRREQAKIKRDDLAAAAVADVKMKLTEETAKQGERLDAVKTALHEESSQHKDKIDNLVLKVDKNIEQQNGAKAELSAAMRQIGFTEGEKSARDKPQSSV